MIKRLSTAAICVALAFRHRGSGGAYYGFDGRNYGEAPKAPNWGRPEAANVKRVKDDPRRRASA